MRCAALFDSNLRFPPAVLLFHWDHLEAAEKLTWCAEVVKICIAGFDGDFSASCNFRGHRVGTLHEMAAGCDCVTFLYLAKIEIHSSHRFAYVHVILHTEYLQ